MISKGRISTPGFRVLLSRCYGRYLPAVLGITCQRSWVLLVNSSTFYLSANLDLDCQEFCVLLGSSYGVCSGLSVVLGLTCQQFLVILVSCSGSNLSAVSGSYLSAVLDLIDSNYRYWFWVVSCPHFWGLVSSSVSYLSAVSGAWFLLLAE